MSPNALQPKRGEIWWVNFNSPITAPSSPAGTPKSQLPTTGDEIYKTRPAVVMNIAAAWRLKLHIVVPITGWQPRYSQNHFFWLVKIPKGGSSNLRKDSAADTFQVQSASARRFKSRLGVVAGEQLALLAATIAFNIGHSIP